MTHSNETPESPKPNSTPAAHAEPDPGPDPRPGPWTAPAVDRGDFPSDITDRGSLDELLDFHRATFLTKCQGLTGDQLCARAVPTSTLTLLGLVRHFAENERWWFRRQFGQDASLGDVFCTEEYPDGDFDLIDPANAEADYATYLAEVELAKQTAAKAELSDEFPGRRDPRNLRWVYLHMIEEYARHNGHADLIREAIDGVTGE